MEAFASAPVVTHPQVLLRGITAADEPRIVQACQDPASIKWTTVPRPYTATHATDFVNFAATQWATPGGVRIFAVEHPARPGEYCGAIDLRPNTARVASVGYLLHPDARGTGLMVHALKAMCQWWFDQGGTVVRWEAWVGNTASVAVARAAGFTLDPGTRKYAATDTDGALRDAYTASLHRDDPMTPSTPRSAAPTITGDGLVLREWTDADVVFVEDENHPAHHTPPGATATAQNFTQWLTKRRMATLRGNGMGWAITDAGSGRVLGDVVLFGIQPGGRPEIGYWVYSSARGNGVATRAVQLAADWAVQPKADGGLGLPRITARYVSDNHASGRILSYAGFTPNGVMAATNVDAHGTPCGLVTMQRLTHPAPHITIVAATPTDWQRVRALHIRALAENPTCFGSTLTETLHLSATDWQENLREPRYFIAVTAGLDVGLVRFAASDHDLTTWEITRMWVDTTMRGHSVGRMLLAAGESCAASLGAQRISLGGMRSAEAAQMLYAQCGYQPTTEPTTQCGCDVTMTKTLPTP